MQPEAFLLAIAQIAVTLAGFSGLVVAIRSTPLARWHARDIWSLSWMLGSSLGALFLALLPLVLALFQMPDEVLWRMSNAAMSMFTCAFGLIMAIFGKRMTRLGHPARVRYFPTAATLLSELVAIVTGLTALDVISAVPIASFVSGLVACLAISASSLVVFLVVLARATRSA